MENHKISVEGLRNARPATPGSEMKRKLKHEIDKTTVRKGGDDATDHAAPAATKRAVSPFLAPAWGGRDTVLLPDRAGCGGAAASEPELHGVQGDEAGTFIAIDLVSGRTFPLVGIMSSIGTYTPAFFAYLMAIPVIFTRNPLLAAGFVALLNCAAVGLTFVFCRRYFGQIAAIIAAGFLR